MKQMCWKCMQTFHRLRSEFRRIIGQHFLWKWCWGCNIEIWNLQKCMWTSAIIFEKIVVNKANHLSASSGVSWSCAPATHPHAHRYANGKHLLCSNFTKRPITIFAIVISVIGNWMKLVGDLWSHYRRAINGGFCSADAHHTAQKILKKLRLLYFCSSSSFCAAGQQGRFTSFVQRE